MESRPRIIFMGTPEFAVASLGALLMNSLNIVAVVTTPDRPAGRGRKLKPSPVSRYCDENYLKVLKPVNLKDPDFIRMLKALEPDLIVVVAFRMLPREVWEIPVSGTFNLHASLLPHYRGAAPINHAIINGETRTGVTTFMIDDRIDTGGILLQKEVPVGSLENAGDLHDKLMREGAKLVVRTVEMLYLNILEPKDQSHLIREGDILKPAPKIFPEDCFINWNEGVVQIYNRIRGLSPHPGARTIISNGEKQMMIKLIESRAVKKTHGTGTGRLLEGDGSMLTITASNGLIEILELQPEGKRRMSSMEFLRGFDIKGYNTV
ncbi:MAG: methionyl-tRNA formyltransferase [Bacteroidales bacterium]|nr:methionyl-tRNA formyltransferase [Bacteroidales bacterium]